MIRKTVQSVLNSIRGGWHFLVWEDVRAGTIQLTGTPRSFRVLMRLGFWLTIFLLVTLVFNDAWRGFSHLQPLTIYNDELAGLYVPELFVPVTFGLLAMAWAFLLTGALHTPWPVKLLILILFGMFDYGLMITPVSLMTGEIELLLSGFSLQQVGVWNLAAVLLQGVGWMFLLGLFSARWRRPARPGLEFPLVLSLTTVLLFAAYFAVQLSESTTGAALSASGLQLTFALGQMDTVLVPFLVIAGVEVVQLGMSLTGIIASRIGETFEKNTAHGLLFWTMGVGMLLLFRLGQQWVGPLLTGAEIQFSWGAVMIWGVFLLIFAGVRPHRLDKSLPGWVIPGVAFLMYAVLFVLEIGSLLSATVGIVLILAGAVTLGNVVVNFMTDFFDLFARWNEILVSVFAGMISAGLHTPIVRLPRSLSGIASVRRGSVRPVHPGHRLPARSRRTPSSPLPPPQRRTPCICPCPDPAYLRSFWDDPHQTDYTHPEQRHHRKSLLPRLSA